MKHKPIHRRNRRRCQRRGTAAIESALIAPVLVIILLGAIDIGQYVNVAQSVSNASREGARLACRNGTLTVSQVEQAVLDYLGDTFPHVADDDLRNACVIEIRDESTGAVISSDLTTLDSGAPLSVTVDFDFNVVRWLPGFDYWSGQYKLTKTVSRRE